MPVPLSSLRRFPDPRSGPWYKMPLGIDIMNTFLEIKNGFAQKLDNMDYQSGTLNRRNAFVGFLLSSNNNLTTDYTAMGAFSLAHEYVDSGGSARLLHAHANGTIQELDKTTGIDTARVTGLTVNKTIRFETFMGACIATNGADLPQRADDSAWRVFGAPAPVTNFAFSSFTATGQSGTWQWVIVPCIQVGGVTVVRGDWSTIVTATPANQKTNFGWTASSDLRVNAYEVYRSFSGLGFPYYLEATVAGRLTVTYQSNVSDAALTGQIIDDSGRNGAAPTAKFVTSSGKRVIFGFIIDATDPDASKTAWFSIIATNKYECEYYPNTTSYRIKLPGKGDLTCVKGIGNKSGQESGTDAFLSQLDSCYLLPQSDPKNQLQPISPDVGVRNQEAFATWGRWAFFVSLRGLEFLGPTGAPIMISMNVNAIFLGGGELGYNGNQGDSNIVLTVCDQVLYIATRQDSGKLCGDTLLTLDLSTFQPYNPDVSSTAKFTIFTGVGFGYMLYTRDRKVIVFDNQNYRILQAGAGAYDHVGGVQTTIDTNIWSGPILQNSPEYVKTISIIELLFITDGSVNPRIDGDYGAVSTGTSLAAISPTFVPRSWDKLWDKTWFANTSLGGSIAIPRGINAIFFQFKLQVNNASATFTFIGLVMHFRQTVSRIFGKR